MTREEAIESIKLFFKGINIALSNKTKEALDVLIPELAESEDERIRKWLVNYFTEIGENWIHREFTCKQIVAYLEKQKNAFENGCQFGIMQEQARQELECLDEKQKKLPLTDEAFKEQLERVLRDNVLDTDIRITGDTVVGATKNLNREIPEWSEEDDKAAYFINQFLEYHEASDPTAKSCKEWFNSRLKSLRPQSKQEWNEEDEKMLNNLIWTVHMKSISPCDEMDDGNVYEKYEKFLKSLRPSWKPSEDEERLINTSISYLKYYADKGYENAVECIDWLKSKLNGNSGK